MIKSICLISFIVLLASCNKRVEMEELPGHYVWNDGRKDTLEIRTDGTYEYWTFRPGVKIPNSGTWRYDSVKIEIEFEKENFPFVYDHQENGRLVF